MTRIDPNIDVFNIDVARNGGYLYSTNARLSSQLAHGRLTEAVLALANFEGQSILDIGCGDGVYSVELYDRARPSMLRGIDVADQAIGMARNRAGKRRITFDVGSAYDLPFANDAFDWAVVRSVLHHMDRPVDALREALRVARRIVVVEPNGYNPILKILERCSRYHVEHDEKSYMPWTLRRWLRAIGSEVTRGQMVGLVPCFCPEWFARLMKTIEPVVECMPIVRSLGCACYVCVVQRGPALSL